MAPSDYRRVVELVDAALELEPPDRSAFLDRECSDDSELRAEVESLLGEEDALKADFLGIPAVLQAVDVIADEHRLALEASDDAARPALPDHVGPYRVLEELGRGGMGTVYLVEQREPIERRIALKVIHGFEGDQGTRRFAAECRALARLKHPNIAAVYDAGVADDRRAFVAMEWVEGSHITEWCDRHRLSIRARIELFLGVCAGVGHAHQKGLVHRDLKPSNVLVAEIDGQAVAKVIDFGIARSLDEAEASAPNADPERVGDLKVDRSQSLLMGSPAYMSPEAASWDLRSEVDTRTDVYSLGILLYELLVGVPPYEASELGVGALLHRARTIDPPPPSRRWAELDTGRRGPLAERRAVGPRALGRHLQGDLDAMLVKATARDRDARYDSAASLAADLRRYLQHRPVEAREPSLGYNLSRYLRRNVGTVLAVAAVIGVLTAGVVARTQEARRANLEADRARQAQVEAEQVSDFLIGLFELADPDRGEDDPESVDELIARAEGSMGDELADQPQVRARFLQTLGRIAMTRSDLDRAAALYERALALREAELDPGDPEIITCVGSLGVIYRRQGRFDEAEALGLRAIELIESAAERDPARLAATVTWLANLHYRLHRFDEAIAGHRRALEIRRSELADNPGAIGESLNNLGVALRGFGRYGEARPILREAEGFFIEAFGDQHPLVVGCWLNLAGIEEQLGGWEEAERLLRRAASAWQEVHGPTHHRTLLARRALGALWRRGSRADEAIVHLEGLLAEQEAAGEGDAREIGRTLRELGRALLLAEDFAGAERVLGRALELYGQDQFAVRRVQTDLAQVAWKRGDLASAVAAFEPLLAESVRQRGEDHPVSAVMFRRLGTVRIEQGLYDEAEALLDQALKTHETLYDVPTRDVAQDLFQLGRLRLKQGRREEGAEFLRRALEIFEGVLPDDHPELLEARAEAVAAAS
ncbi:MAG: tetratricopeptide repeat protein [Acidobacteriota bacterium]